MKILTTVLIWIFVAGGVLAGQEPAGPHTTADENILHALVRVGRAGSVPLGIVQPDDGALCRTITDIIPEHPQNSTEKIKWLAEQAGYEVIQSEGALVVRPNGVQSQLATVMNHRFPRFPAMHGTMGYMGMTLQGWLETSVGGAKGYAMSSASSTEAKILKLPESKSSTAMEIASRIVGLGPKGAWILSEDPNPDGKSLPVKIRTYSYEDNVWSLDRLPCSQPSAQKTPGKNPYNKASSPTA